MSDNRPRKRHPQLAQYMLSAGVSAEMAHAVDVWAERAGVSRSALIRHYVDEGLAKTCRNGRYWLRRKLRESGGKEVNSGT